MNRRDLIRTGSAGVLIAAAGSTKSAVASSDATRNDVFYVGDPLLIVRADPDGLVVIDGQVNGAVRRPSNYARVRREMFGPDHWDKLFFKDSLPSRDEAYYEQKRPVICALYVDLDRHKKGIVNSPARYLPEVSHIGDVGEGVHRWVYPGEEILPLSEWKWSLGSIPAEDVWSAVTDDPKYADHYE